MIAMLQKVFGDPRDIASVRPRCFPPKWSFLPDEIGQQYQSGDTLFDLSLKYRVSPRIIARKLSALGILPRIDNKSFKPKSKLTPAQITWILEQDLKDVPHSEIGEHVGVTRERVRQICLAANHKTRMERLTKVSQLKDERSARKIARFKIIEEAARMYREGADFKQIHLFLRPNARGANYMIGASLVATYRKKYPELFPYRRANHWNRRRAP